MDDSLAELGSRIRNAIAVETSEQEEQELYYDLEHCRPRLLQLFDVGVPSGEEAKNIENREWILGTTLNTLTFHQESTN
jgi:hypothetical protein